MSALSDPIPGSTGLGQTILGYIPSGTSTFLCDCCGASSGCLCCSFSPFPATLTLTITRLSGPTDWGLDGILTLVWNSDTGPGCDWSVTVPITGHSGCTITYHLSCSNFNPAAPCTNFQLSGAALNPGFCYSFNVGVFACACSPLDIVFRQTLGSPSPICCGGSGTPQYEFEVTP